MVKWLKANIFYQKVLLCSVNRRTGSSAFGVLPQYLQQKSDPRSSMAACMSVFGGAQSDRLCICSPARRKDQAFGCLTALVELSPKSVDYSGRAPGTLKIGGKCSDSLLPRYALDDATLCGRVQGDYKKPQGRGFHLSTLSSFSAGSPADVSFDGTLNEEALEDPTTSTDLKTDEGKSLKLVSGSCYLPHPEKEETGGEDAHFICTEEQSIGVADGVGGWVELGINAGIYAQQLMSNSAAAIRQEPEGSIDPKRVLGKAHSLTKVLGSSTACIITLTEQAIRAANLGDSGFIVVRDGRTLFQSPSQQHGFNFPYQLEFGGNADNPSVAEVFAVDVAIGDVVVAGTDGLFDNLFGNEIASVLGDAVMDGLSPKETAEKIARLAQLRAMTKECQTPFSSAAKQAGYLYYGGKLDDITVVVSYVT